MFDPNTNQRQCDELLSALPQETVEEIELSFEYGVESTSEGIHRLIDEMDILVLDFLAMSVLRCAGEGKSEAVQLRSGLEGGNAIGYMGVVRIRFAEYGNVSSICECVRAFVT
jgi:hypothetical protein